jgi:hypothetical protein
MACVFKDEINNGSLIVLNKFSPYLMCVIDVAEGII